MSKFLPLAGSSIAHATTTTDVETLELVATRLEEIGAVKASFRQAVLAREATFPTGLPTVIGSAIPHTDPEHVLTEGIAAVTLNNPVEFRPMGGGDSTISVKLVVVMLLKAAHSQLEGLQLLMQRLQDESGITTLLESNSDEELEARANTWISGSGS